MKYMKAKECDVLAIDNISNDDWQRPIVEYLKKPTGTKNRKVKYRELSYTIMCNKLFKNTP